MISPKSRRWPSATVLGLILPVLLAAAIRLPSLSEADLSGDEIGLYTRLLQRPSVVDILADHHSQFARYKALPLARIAAWAATIGRDGNVEARSLRLVFAVAGVLGVAALWWLGYELSGASLAVVLALIAALNPFHIFLSRQAHVHAVSILFATLFYAAVARLTLRLLHHGRADYRLWAVATVFAVAASQSHLQAWPAVALGWGFPISAWVSRSGQARTSLAWVLVGPLVWLLILAPWILALIEPLGPGAFTGVSEGFGPGLLDLWRLPLAMTFGGGWRLILTLGLPLLAFWSHATRGIAGLMALFATALFSTLSVLQIAGTPTLREYALLWPMLLTLAGIGVLAAGRLASGWGVHRHLIAGLGFAVLLATYVAPVSALLQLRGSPVEYTRIAETLDGTFSENTPALVNGRSVVEHEMRPYWPQRVVPTFTVPDAGLEQWLDNRWRQTAVDFLERFSDAPLVQQGRNYYHVESVGPWDFPARFFARRIVLRNEPALMLARLNLAAVEDFYGPRTVTDISYNRAEDVIDRARLEGRAAVVLWGAGWGYAKTSDFRDWRVMRHRAELLLHNLTEEQLGVRLDLNTQATAGRKRIRINGQTLEVPAQEEDQRLQIRLEVPPGEQRIVLEDDLYAFGRVPLGVESISVDVDDGAEPTL